MLLCMKWPPEANFTRGCTSATAVINVTTDVVQIQDNGNDLEEEGGEYFVDIEPDGLDLSGLLRRLLRQLLRRLL